MLRRSILLLAAVGLLAWPADAAANPVWDEEGAVTLSGSFGFLTANWGWHQNSEIELALYNDPGTGAEGEVLSFKSTNCTGTGGPLENYPCVATPTGLPGWPITVDPETGDLIIEEIVIHISFFGGAVKTALTGAVRATPNALSPISSVSLSSEGAEAGGSAAEVSGELEASNPETFTLTLT